MTSYPWAKRMHHERSYHTDERFLKCHMTMGNLAFLAGNLLRYKHSFKAKFSCVLRLE